jgi:NRAMP (natural resistance-associated macrophage protein)-like metal ion transporter
MPENLDEPRSEHNRHHSPLTPKSESAAKAEDAEDLDRARNLNDKPNEDAPWYKAIGPGLITGAADDDPSGIGTYSQCGAAFGYGQLWLVPFCLPLMIAVQEMCGRVGLVTGKGVAAVMKEHYPKWMVYGALSLLVCANTLNVFADLNVMAASAKMLFGLPTWLWLTVFAIVLVGLQIVVPYRRYARILKFLCLGLVGYVVVALLPGVRNDWPAIIRNLFIPSWSMKLDYLIATVAFLGTTISPYLFYWQAGETVEEVVAEGKSDGPGSRTVKVDRGEIRNLRADTTIGMVASQGVAFFIMIATAGTLYRYGLRDIDTAQQAAQALRPLGNSAVWIFAICMIGTGLLAIPTLAGSVAYATSETMGWRYGLYRRFDRAPGFYLTVAAVVAVGYILNFFSTISPIKALVYSAVVNGIVAVPLMVLLMSICNNREIVGDRVNGKWSNLFGRLSIVFMGAASAFFLWAVFTGHA